jgi:hypothetical protein
MARPVAKVPLQLPPCCPPYYPPCSRYQLQKFIYNNKNQKPKLRGYLFIFKKQNYDAQPFQSGAKALTF